MKCDHTFGVDDVCDVCGYSAGYLLINAERRIADLERDRDAWKAEAESHKQWEIGVKKMLILASDQLDGKDVTDGPPLEISSLLRGIAMGAAIDD